MNAELETTQPSGEIAEAEAQEIAREALAGIDSKDLVLPLLSVAQPQSRVVASEEQERGSFFDTLSGTGYGDAVELVVCHYFKGRFYSDDDDNVFVAASEVAPSNWPEEYAGRRFDEIDDAEERHAARANDPDDSFEWGRGPKIDTTHNYVGYVPSEDGEPTPVRLSLRRSSIPAHRKIATILSFARAPWDQTVQLSTELRTEPKPHYVVRAAKGRQTTVEERQTAVALAGQVQQAAVRFTGDENEKRAKPKPSNDGGLEV